MKTAISRKKFVQCLQSGPHLCATAFDPKRTSFMDCGLRAVHGVTSYGAQLLCGKGSPHEGEISDLRFQTGDVCEHDSDTGILLVTGSHVSMRYTPAG